MVETMYNDNGDILHTDPGIAPLAAANRLIDEITCLQNKRQTQKDDAQETKKQKASLISKGVSEVSIPVLSIKYLTNNLLALVQIVTGKTEMSLALSWLSKTA